MLGEEIDRQCWMVARGLGRDAFIDQRIRVGFVLGGVLAAWSALVDASSGDAAGRVLVESAYYLGGSVVLTGLAARLEWASLRRRFGG